MKVCLHSCTMGVAAALLFIGESRQPLVAQAEDHPVLSTARPSCLDSIPASAMTRVAVYGMAKFTSPVSQELRASTDILLQDVAFRLPTLLGTKAGVLPAGEPIVTWRGLAAPLHVTVRRDGRLTHRIPRNRADTAAAAMLARALDLTASEAAAFIWGADSLRDSVSFEIELGWSTVDRHGRVTPAHFESTALLMFSVMHPWEEMVSPVVHNVGPRYPDAARRAGYGGLVKMQFVVDTAGRAVESTMKALWPDSVPPLQGSQREMYTEFVEAVRSFVPKTKFKAAVIGGCKTEQLVVMPFQFSLGRR